MRTKANRSDVLDELKFIANPANNYSVMKRVKARDLYNTLSVSEFDPTAEYARILELHGGHLVEVPKGLKKLKEACHG